MYGFKVCYLLAIPGGLVAGERPGQAIRGKNEKVFTVPLYPLAEFGELLLFDAFTNLNLPSFPFCKSTSSKIGYKLFPLFTFHGPYSCHLMLVFMPACLPGRFLELVNYCNK